MSIVDMWGLAPNSSAESLIFRVPSSGTAQPLQTWFKPRGCGMIHGLLAGGGGGGGGGAQSGAGTNAWGGGGGGSGGVTCFFAPAYLFPDKLLIFVGAGGLGGAGASAGSGVNGIAGSDTNIYWPDTIASSGDPMYQAIHGNLGNGGSNIAGGAGGSGGLAWGASAADWAGKTLFCYPSAGASGGNGSSGIGANGRTMFAGGGPGGGVNSADLLVFGADFFAPRWGSGNYNNSFGGTGDGIAGDPGQSYMTPLIGIGGGGGCGGKFVNGGAGGIAGTSSGGGGGGGGRANGGAGGRGGDGIVIITTW